MHVELCRLSRLSGARSTALEGLTAAVYPPALRARHPAQRLTWARHDWGALVWQPDQGLVAFAGALLRQGRHAGAPVRIGGIGGVKSHPRARGLGHGGAAVRRLVAFLAEQPELDFALLFCAPEVAPFYDRLGWTPFAGEVVVTRHGTKAPLDGFEAMTCGLARPAPRAGLIDVCGLPW